MPDEKTTSPGPAPSTAATTAAVTVAPASTPAEVLPAAGGSYIRQADGSLKRVGGTEPAEDRAETHPQAGEASVTA